MTFLNPSFLWALLLIAIPIIIHLFNFRKYTTVYFSQVKFLQNIKKETKSKSQLKNLLLLLIRCLVIGLLVVVFAKPILLSSNQTLTKDQKYIVLYIDNSFSMQSVGRDGILLESAKIKALDIVKGFGEESKFALLTNEFYLEQQQFVSREQVITWISNIQETHLIRPLDEINERSNILFKNVDEAENRYCFMLSDFQKATTRIEQMDVDSSCVYRAVIFEPLIGHNLWVDSVWFSSPEHYVGKKEDLMVRINNASDEKLNDFPVSLYINDTLKTTINVSIEAREDKVVHLSYFQNNPGKVNARVELNDYPITFDNTLYFNYNLKKETKILTINNANSTSFIEHLYELEPNYKLTSVNVSSIPYGQLNEYGVLVLNGLNSIPSGLMKPIEEFVLNGGTLLVMPSFNCDVETYNQFLKTSSLVPLERWKGEKGRVVNLNRKHRLFSESFKSGNEELDLPTYAGFYSIGIHSNSQFESLYESESGQPLFVHERLGNGHLFLSGLPLDVSKTNLMLNPIFVPLIYNIAMQSGAYGPLYHSLKPSMMVEVNSGQAKVLNPVLSALESENSIQPLYKTYLGDVRLFLDATVLHEGFYNLQLDQSNSYGLSFNNDRNESDMAVYTKSELKRQFEDKNIENILVLDGEGKQLSKKIKQMNEGFPLGRYLVVVVLLLLLSEAIVLRFLK